MANVRAIREGRECPYCGSKSVYMDSTIFYGVSYGMVYACIPCKAWVGVHRGTDKALGRLASAELRELKKAAHSWFDPLWQKAIKDGMNKYRARGRAYRWLANEMKVTPEECHIGMFTEEQCKQVIEICKKYYK